MRKKIISGIICFLLAIEVIFIIDVLLTFTFKIIISPYYIIAFLVVIAAVFFFSLFKISIKKKLVILTIIPIILVLIIGSCSILYFNYSKLSLYDNSVSSYKEAFKNKKVMFIVPHEDDDLNLVSGVIENYIECGSDVYPVFVTNGDYRLSADIRLNESLQCWDYLGVPSENVFFLGYGDQWDSKGPHIYNSKGDKELVSAAGYKYTYGLDAHPAYHNNIKYTHYNLLNDLISIISEIKPDILFVSDYDKHPDHRATSLMTEKAIGKLLKYNKSYKPIVYKGYAYSTAWQADSDFYSLNILSTKKNDIFDNTIKIYDWNSRVRFPVNNSVLSRSVFKSSTYGSLSEYISQGAASKAINIINGDKVFWQRRTDSILYDAKIYDGTKTLIKLNDFRMLDSLDVKISKRKPYDGVCVFNNNDTFSVELKEKKDISLLYLYDNPSPDDNILNIEIKCNNGKIFNTGPLNKDGSATILSVKQKNVESFNFRITESEGKKAGLTEIEAYESSVQDIDKIIKIIDNDDNFVYDYLTNEDYNTFGLYSTDSDYSLTKENYKIECDNIKCSAKIEKNKIIVYCPKNENCKIRLTKNGEKIFDEIKVNHISSINKFGYKLFQRIEEKYVYPISQYEFYNLAEYRLLHELKSLVVH